MLKKDAKLIEKKFNERFEKVGGYERCQLIAIGSVFTQFAIISDGEASGENIEYILKIDNDIEIHDIIGVGCSGYNKYAFKIYEDIMQQAREEILGR